MLRCYLNWAKLTKQRKQASCKPYSCANQDQLEHIESLLSSTNVGAGGPWAVLAEHQSPNVVRQINRHSCVSACGEMLSAGILMQNYLIPLIGAPSATEFLAPHLGPRWSVNGIDNQTLRQLLTRNRPFGAELVPPQARPVAHLVVVDG